MQISLNIYFLDCQPSTLANRPRYANNLQPWPIGHATRTTFNRPPSTLANRPRYANNLQPTTFNLQAPTFNLPFPD
ncbi:hypothetical protein [Moorena sp. SIO3I6]|uniref:hypothetical protein n=1 Tax=Moorena sp. SIO3I6 TaxID=2607831 RepID=UPI0013F7511F|nr:hypothetical protein [Moorena sp. SIO3I6]NEP21786.1 hypothetical protein [Moorena sp. SIO3I6]